MTNAMTNAPSRHLLLANMRRAFATGTPVRVGSDNQQVGWPQKRRQPDQLGQPAQPDQTVQPDPADAERYLDMLDEVLAQVEQRRANQPSVQPTDQQTDHLIDQLTVRQTDQPLSQPVTQQFNKEREHPAASLDQPGFRPTETPTILEPTPPTTRPVEQLPPPQTTELNELAAAGLAAAEHEPRPEIPVEVESYLRHAEEHPDHLPQEIVIADDHTVKTVPHTAKTPVIVLPFTPEVEERGRKKSPKFSIRWLIEWGHKLMKKFAGRIIYRPDANPDASHQIQSPHQPGTPPEPTFHHSPA